VELFEIIGIVENNLNVKKSYRLWWMLDEEVSFRVIKVDADTGEIKHYTLKKLSVVNSFVEHNVD
jgi:hypothetical protein